MFFIYIQNKIPPKRHHGKIAIRSVSSEVYSALLALLRGCSVDKEILKSPSSWLLDAIINAAQILLKRGDSMVACLQNINLGQTNSFTIQTGVCIQILHTGEGHWHITSTIGTKNPNVNGFFDIMYCFLF
jgi:hypothetical protein